MIKIIHDHQINHVGEILDVKRCVSKVSKYIIIVCTVHKIHNMLSLFVTHKTCRYVSSKMFIFHKHIPYTTLCII